MMLGAVLIATWIAPFIGIIFWASMKAPVKSEADPSFLVKFRFLFFRFRPTLWWWGCAVYARQTFLAFAASVHPDDPYAQILYVVFVVIVYMTTASRYWPWKSDEINFGEVFALTFYGIL